LKKTKILVNIIAFWQLLLTLPFIYAVIMRINELGYWDTTRIRNQELMNGIIQTNILTLFFTVLVFVSVFGSIGLFAKKNWGRKLSASLSVILMIFGCYLLYAVFGPVFGFSHESFFVDIILPTMISVILVLYGVFSLTYLVRLSVQAYFKKPQIEPAGPVSSN
jgi:hypothetical protein